MNKIEKEMISVLEDLKINYSVLGLKAEFEAEGTRTEELMRLKEICNKTGITLTLKIGGCDGMRDMYNARVVGTDHLLAPMIESPYALEKYISLVKKVFPFTELENIDILINIETIQSVKKFDDMLKVRDGELLNGIVLGRSDLTGSMGYDDKNWVDSDEIFEISEEVLTKAKKNGLKCILGGTITANSLNFLKKLVEKNLLDKFETRKVSFDSKIVLGDNALEGINKAIYFELLWLKSKREYYKNISLEDLKRIENLEKRFK